MGRGGRGRGGGGRRQPDAGEKLDAFFEAISSQKADTISWSLRNGGLTLMSRNEEGRTGLIEAADQGRPDSLEALLRFVRDCRDYVARGEALNATDDEGKTATIAAVEGGHLECIRALVTSRARLDLADSDGQTAYDYAARRQDILDILDGKAKPPSDAGSESEASDDAPPGETGAQRRKRKKMVLSCASVSKPSAKRASASKAESAASAAGGALEEVAAVDPNAIPVLPEVAAALSSGAHELTIEREGSIAGLAEGELDPAIWRCQAVSRLQLRFPSGLQSSTLSCLGSLRKLQTLIIRESGFNELPDVLGALSELRSLDVDKNRLLALPASLARLVSLESLSANGNVLASAAPVATLVNLQTLALSGNQLKNLDDLCLAKKTHLTALRLANNLLTELPDSVGDLLMMQHFDVSGNRIVALPLGLGRLKEKKLTEMILDNNPIKDGKIRNMIERSAVLSKDVLTYLRKQKPSKGKKGGPNKHAESSDDEPNNATPAPAPESAEELAERVARREELARAQVEREAEKLRLAEASKKAKKAERRALEERMQAKTAEQEEARERERELAVAEGQEREERRQGAEKERQEAHDKEEARRARLSPEERAAEDRSLEAARLKSEREAVVIAEKRAAEASQQAEKNEEKARQLAAMQADEGLFKFVFHHGAVHKVRIGPGPNSSKKSGGAAAGQGSKGGQKGGTAVTLQEGELEVPAEMIGRLIGTGGATIKELCSSTGANINVKRGSEARGLVPVAVSGNPAAVDRALKRIGDLLAAS